MKTCFKMFCLTMFLAVTTDVLAQATATLTKSFNPTTINSGGVTTLTFTLTNPANNPAQTVSFTDNLPAGLRIASPAVINCVNVQGTDTIGTQQIVFTTATVPAGGASTPTSCTVTLGITNVPGQTGTCPNANFTNAAANIANATNVINGVQSSCVTVTAVNAQPTLTKSFNPTTFPPGGTTTLTFTITNPIGNAQQTFSFTDTLPAGLQIAANPAVTGVGCTPAGSAIPNGTQIVVTNVTVGPGTTTPTVCTLSVAITNVSPWSGQTGTCPNPSFTNAAANISATTNIVNAVQSSCVAVTTGQQAQAPTLTKSFNPTTIAAGGTTTLTFTVTNPANNPAQAFGFTDTLPAGLVLAAVPNAQSNCTNLTGQTPVAGGNQIIINNTAMVGAGTATPTTCTFSVAVTNAQGQTGTCPAANFTNAAANISGTTNLTNGVQSSCVTVTGGQQAQVPTLTKALNPGTIAAGGTSTLTFTITNPATNNPAQTFSFTDALPTGLMVATPAGIVNNCTGGTVTAAAGGGTINVGGGTAVGASTATPTTCTVSVNITNVAGQSNASCANNPLAFTNGAANIAGNSNITTNVAPSCLVVTPQANTFAITKLASTPFTTPGSPLSYTITVTNNGPGAANNALLTDPAIAGFAASGISCTNATAGAVCPAVGTVTVGSLQGAGIALPTFPANSAITFVLSGTFTGSGSTVNTATITTAPGVTPVATASAAATVAVSAAPATNIPTLGEYALLALMTLLAFAGAMYARRVRR